jgi:uncharacterized protein
MFTEMRQLKRQLSRPETEAILAKGLYGILSMNGEDYAYGVPLSYVYQGNSLYVHCALEGRKLTLLRRNNKVSFCVVEEAEPLPDKFSMKYRSAMAFGQAVEVDRDEEKLAALIALVEKYYQDEEHREKGRQYAADSLPKTLIIRIDLDHLTGKARK